MSTAKIPVKVIIGGVSVAIDDVVVCPLTGQFLLRTVESATKHGVADTGPYVAKEIILSGRVGTGSARAVAMVHPDVDPETLR